MMNVIKVAVFLIGCGISLFNLLSDERCEFVLWNGVKRMFKRKKLEDYLEKAYSI